MTPVAALMFAGCTAVHAPAAFPGSSRHGLPLHKPEGHTIITFAKHLKVKAEQPET